MNSLLRGAIAGGVATFPMTVAIEILNRSLERGARNPLPPRQITAELAQRTRAERHASEEALDAATMISHFGFGASMGILYAPFAVRTPLSPQLAGPLFGMLVWTAGYTVVLPALGLQPPPDRRPHHRNTTMVVGHLVWGVTLGWMENRLRDRSQSDDDSLRSWRHRQPATLREHTEYR